MNPTLFTALTALAVIAEMDLRKTQIGEADVISITGPYKLLGYMLKFVLFAGMITYEQIAKFGIRADGKNVHLVLTSSKPTIGKDAAIELPVLSGYKYIHAIAAFYNSVNVSLFDKGFNPNKNETIGKAYGQFAAAIFDNGKVRGSDTNTLLLLGTDTKDRVLCASMYGKQNPLTVINQEIKGDARFSFILDTTIVAASYGTDQVAGLHVSSIIEMFVAGTTPVWNKQLLNGIQIEEITTSIGNQPTVAITFKKIGARRQLGLAHIGWIGKNRNKFQLVLDASYVTDVPGNKAPAVRLSETTLVAVDGNGSGAPRLRIKDLDHAKDAKLKQIAKAAASGEPYQQAFAKAA